MTRDLLPEVQDIGQELDEVMNAVQFVRVSCDELRGKVDVAPMMPGVMAVLGSKLRDIDVHLSELGRGLMLQAKADSGM